VSGRQTVKALIRIGYQIVRQRGSHIRLRDETNPDHLPITVPDHKTLKPGLLGQILRDANLTVNQFLTLL
ncbi:MAG: type II toxin-antitoxin system HicA family toxin, partial [Anaerolineae bacterium]|nr:type II toxin-antitoxin system HicA family toxin [Anaerolineae bacterium]